MKKIPIFDDFRQCVLKEFAAILKKYSFVEQPLPGRKFENKFQVRFANATTLIIVEGISYGLETWTKVCKLSSSIEDDYGLPIWRLVNERRGVPWPPKKKSKKKKELDQLEQIAEQAACLSEYAQDILQGDFAEIDRIVEKEKVEKEKQKLNAPSPEQRAANVAASDAGHEFNKKNYLKVVEILKPHLSLLSKSQIKRFEIAKKHLDSN